MKEEIVKHKFYTNNINVIKWEICLELQILDKQEKQRKEPHTCQKCQNRKDPMYFLRRKKIILFGMKFPIVKNSSEIKMEIGCCISKGQLSSQG